jgi:hypothetical protein
MCANWFANLTLIRNLVTYRSFQPDQRTFATSNPAHHISSDDSDGLLSSYDPFEGPHWKNLVPSTGNLFFEPTVPDEPPDRKATPSPPSTEAIPLNKAPQQPSVCSPIAPSARITVDLKFVTGTTSGNSGYHGCLTPPNLIPLPLCVFKQLSTVDTTGFQAVASEHNNVYSAVIDSGASTTCAPLRDFELTYKLLAEPSVGGLLEPA